MCFQLGKYIILNLLKSEIKEVAGYLYLLFLFPVLGNKDISLVSSCKKFQITLSKSFKGYVFQAPFFFSVTLVKQSSFVYNIGKLAEITVRRIKRIVTIFPHSQLFSLSPDARTSTMFLHSASNFERENYIIARISETDLLQKSFALRNV